MIVVDSSVVVEALLQEGPRAKWAEEVLLRDSIFAPHVMPAEVANVLRRLTLNGDVPERLAATALSHLGAMRIGLAPFEPFSERVWQLRDTVTSYDAWYIAMAESLNAELATLDARLALVPGPTCAFSLPPG